MAWQTADRVKETSTTTGTGALTLAGAMTGFRAFSSVCSNGDTCYYSLAQVDGNGNPTGAWEVGVGTYATSGNTLTRTTILASSNSGSAVNLAAGTTQVWIDMPAAALYPQSTVCAFQAQNTTAQSIPASTTTTLTGWTAVKDDSNGAMNFSTGVFTAPVTGWYQVSGLIRTATVSWAAADQIVANINVNGTAVQSSYLVVQAAVSANFGSNALSGVVYMTAGQTLTFAILQTHSAAVTLSGSAMANVFNVALIAAQH
jgi:hypothetical protein